MSGAVQRGGTDLPPNFERTGQLGIQNVSHLGDRGLLLFPIDLSTGLLKLRSGCARGVEGAQPGNLGRSGVPAVNPPRAPVSVYRSRQIGLRATQTFLSLTSAPNRQNFLGASRRNTL